MFPCRRLATPKKPVQYDGQAVFRGKIPGLSLSASKRKEGVIAFLIFLIL
jgi:hypothetical protein